MMNKKNISNAFDASLSFGFEKEAKDYSLNKEDLVIKKYAGISIYQPTAANIEAYIKKYVLQELSFFPQMLDVIIQLAPQEMDNVHQDYVSDATGTAVIKYLGEKIELPFLVTDGELVPFDIIQIKGQRCPFSRENLKKLLFGLKHLSEKKKAEESDDPYIGLGDKLNPASTTGFLGSVLQIREQALAAGSGNMTGNSYIYASEMIEELLEKTAEIKEFTLDDMKTLEKNMIKSASEEVKEEMEKFAEEAAKPEDSEQLQLFEKQKNLQYKNAIDLPNGTAITFPEKNGNEISMTNAIVVDNFMDFADKAPSKVKLVVAQDGRVKILSNSERFLCLPANGISFKMKQIPLDSLQEGDVFMAFDGDKALFPSRMNWINTRDYGAFTDKVLAEVKTYEITPIYNNSAITEILTTSEGQNILDYSINVRLCTLDDAKFWELPYGDFIANKSKQTGIDEIKLSDLMGKGICISSNKVENGNRNYPRAIDNTYKETNKVLCTDPHTKVIKITGVIRDGLKDKADLDKMAFVENTDDVLEKTAAIEKNKIKITLRDKQLEAYDVEINFLDESKPVFKRFVKTYQRISATDLKQLLLLVGYGQMETQQIMYKAKNNPFIIYALPANPNIQALQGARTKTLAEEKVKNTVKSMVRPKELVQGLASAIIGSMLADGISKSPENAQRFMAGLGSYASVTNQEQEKVAKVLKDTIESGKILSSVFEKIAQEKKSPTAFDVASLMSLSAMFTEKVAAVVSNDTMYPRLSEVAKDIMENRFVLEKTAGELIRLKVAQYVKRNEMINPNYIQQAVEQLDQFHKIAYATCATKYDMAEIMEKEAAFDLSKFSPRRLDRVITKVSTKTGAKPEHIKKMLMATGAIGAGTAVGVGLSGIGEKKAEFHEECAAANKEKKSDKDPESHTEGEEKKAGLLGGAIVGSAYGLGSAYPKAIDQAKAENPGALPSDYESEVLGKAAGGALTGAIIGGAGGAGIKAIKSKVNTANAAKAAKAAKETENVAKTLSHMASEELDEMVKDALPKKASEELFELFKQAEMNVPTEAEKKKENNVAPEDEGLADLHCEVCGYVGQPTHQGFCPECGALGGVKPTNPEHYEDAPTASHDLGGDIAAESAASFDEIQ